MQFESKLDEFADVIDDAPVNKNPTCLLHEKKMKPWKWEETVEFEILRVSSHCNWIILHIHEFETASFAYMHNKQKKEGYS